jgi:hypothetical protein
MKIVTLLLLASALGSHAHAQEAARLRGFSVVLLLGEQQGSVPTEGLSKSALRAIADIREFLPYKGYRVLDTQWVAGSEFGESKGQIRGLDNFTYEFALETRPREVASKPGAPHGPLDWARFRLVSVGGTRTLFDNQFSIKPGETVVVGTSRVKGESAMIVVLTAVTAGK